jgi:hypothetical protein
VSAAKEAKEAADAKDVALEDALANEKSQRMNLESEVNIFGIAGCN